MTCLESMFYGRAVIATECGGPSEIIENSSTGILVPVKQVAQMASAMEYMIVHPAERNEISEKAYRSVREKFSHKNTIEKLGEVYHSALLK